VIRPARRASVLSQPGGNHDHIHPLQDPGSCRSYSKLDQALVALAHAQETAMTIHVPDKYRLRTGPLASDASYGNNGAFTLPLGTRYASVIASDGAEIDRPRWEHVSVSFKDRCPTWDEMCKVKAIFWDAEDVVIQYHPAESEYVNNFPFCLHLWRPVGVDLPCPPAFLVGVKGRGILRPTRKKVRP
jgi:hypothetical protein